MISYKHIVFLLRPRYPVGKIAEKAVSKSVFLTIWHCILRHCILSAKLTKTHSLRLFFFLAILSTRYAEFVFWIWQKRYAYKINYRYY